MHRFKFSFDKDWRNVSYCSGISCIWCFCFTVDTLCSGLFEIWRFSVQMIYSGFKVIEAGYSSLKRQTTFWRLYGRHIDLVQEPLRNVYTWACTFYNLYLMVFCMTMIFSNFHVLFERRPELWLLDIGANLGVYTLPAAHMGRQVVDVGGCWIPTTTHSKPSIEPGGISKQVKLIQSTV